MLRCMRPSVHLNVQRFRDSAVEGTQAIVRVGRAQLLRRSATTERPREAQDVSRALAGFAGLESAPERYFRFASVERSEQRWQISDIVLAVGKRTSR